MDKEPDQKINGEEQVKTSPNILTNPKDIENYYKTIFEKSHKQIDELAQTAQTNHFFFLQQFAKIIFYQTKELTAFRILEHHMRNGSASKNLRDEVLNNLLILRQELKTESDKELEELKKATEKNYQETLRNRSSII